MKLFVCIYDDARLLPHFLDHYQKLGATEFHIATSPQFSDYIRTFSNEFEIHVYDQLNTEDSFLGGVEAVSMVRERVQGADEWVLILDLDEFVELDISANELAAKVDAAGANVARGIMFDRFALDGQPKSFDENSDLRKLFPVRARFTKEVMQGYDIKGFLVKGPLKSKGAHHTFFDQKPYPQMFEISHYKWNDRALERVRSAWEKLTKDDKGWAWQYKIVLDHYEQHGRLAWELFGGEVVS